MTQPEHRLESPKEVAERLGWPIARVRKLIRTKELRHMKVGGLYLIPRGAIEDFLSSRIVEPAPGMGGSGK